MTIEPLTAQPGAKAAQRKLLIAIAIIFVLKLVVYLLVIPAYSKQLDRCGALVRPTITTSSPTTSGTVMATDSRRIRL